MTNETNRSVEPMTPNTTLENTQYRMDSSPIRELKRKAGEEVINIEDKENEGVEKKAKIEAASSLVELKGRKLIFKQEPASRKLPRRQLLNFEGWLLDEVEAGNKISSIPEEFHGLIVMAGHELTSSNESLFIKHLKSALELTKGGQDPLPNEVIAPLITRFFTMKHYGFVPSDFSPSTSTVKIPAALQIRCWEANDVEQHFPAGQTEEIVTRRKEREQAREDCLRILTGLDDIEKLELIKGEKVDKTQTKEVKEKASKIEEPEASPLISRRKSREGTANTVESRGRSASPTKKTKLTPEEEEAARLKKEEREAKKAEVAEKKAAKEKEQERRAAIVAKQAKTMMGFFKAKPPATPLISRASEAGPSNLKGSVSPVKGGGSDYARAFRPMNQRPHVHVAEINQWRSTPQSTVSGWSERKETDVNSWKARDFLDDHLMKHGNRSRAARTRLPKGLKIMPPSGSVAEVYSTLEDAEDPRAVLSQLQDRRKFPWKTLSFDQQARPPYCGTFTKKSVVVGPRTPFAQDPIFDYSYDSSDDWVDDEGGEDVDDFGEGEAKEDEDDEEGSESEGEFDDWLDDAEDVEFTPVDGDTGSLNGPEQARLPMKVVKKSRDIPKKVVKLIPTWKGPVWESRIGEEGSEGLEGYRIQLLNDTPSSFDPFTYCSPEPAQTFKASFSTTAIGISLNVRCLLSTDLVVSPPPPPPTNVPEKIISVPNSSSISSKPVYDTPTSVANGDSPAQLPSRSRPPPKVAFPEEHLPELYRMIDGSKKIKPDLVSQLRERFENIATKAAIEAKLKEVAIREGKTKDSQWKVKADAWISVGLTPPAAGSNPASAPPTNPSADALSNFFSSPARSTAANPVLNGNAPGKTADEPMVIDA